MAEETPSKNASMVGPDSNSHREENCDNQVSSPSGGGRTVPAGNAPNVSFRGLGGWIAGGIGAAIGWFGGNAYTENKLLDFKREVDKLTRADILNRQGGVGAAVGSLPTGMEHMPTPMGGFGAGLGSPVIEEFHELNLIQSGKYPFAKFVRVFGKGTVAAGAAVVAGLAAALAYLTFAPKRTEQNIQNVLASAPEGIPIMPLVRASSPLAADAPKPKDWQASIAGGEKDAAQHVRT